MHCDLVRMHWTCKYPQIYILRLANYTNNDTSQSCLTFHKQSCSNSLGLCSSPFLHQMPWGYGPTFIETHEEPPCRHVIGSADELLTHWGRVTHICVSNLTTIGSVNGLSPGRRQAITWTNVGILLIWPLGTNFSKVLIKIPIFSFKKMHLKVSSVKWRPFCLGLNVLMHKTYIKPDTQLQNDNPLACTWTSFCRRTRR